MHKTGSERRFLVPPPSAYILGSSWWTHLPDAFSNNSKAKLNFAGNPAVQLMPPEVRVAMAHDPVATEPFLEWTTYNGNTADKIASAEDFAVGGRVVGKQLYIPDGKDENGGRQTKDTKNAVEALVTIVSPGQGSDLHRTIGTFTSRPIKVISKPSKKAQNSKKGNVQVTHGGTVALFNRLRSREWSSSRRTGGHPA